MVVLVQLHCSGLVVVYCLSCGGCGIFRFFGGVLAFGWLWVPMAFCHGGWTLIFACCGGGG